MYTGTLPPRSNVADWSETIEFTDATTGEVIDITGATEITVRLRDPDSCAVVLEDKLSANTVTIMPPNAAAFAFTAAQMSALRPAYYEFGTTITINGATEQIHLGTIQILQGL